MCHVILWTWAILWRSGLQAVIALFLNNSFHLPSGNANANTHTINPTSTPFLSPNANPWAGMTDSFNSFLLRWVMVIWFNLWVKLGHRRSLSFSIVALMGKAWGLKFEGFNSNSYVRRILFGSNYFGHIYKAGEFAIMLMLGSSG